MGKLFKTFWRDNKLIIAIVTIIMLVVSFVIPTAFLGIMKLNSSNSYSYYLSEQTEMTLIFSVFAAFILMFVYGLMIPAVSVFISFRTTKGSARLRYSSITTSRWSFSFFNLIMYVLLSLLILGAMFLGLTLVCIIFSLDFSYFAEAMIDAAYSLNFGSVIFITLLSSFFSFIFTFYYWQIMFLIPHTKVFRRLPFVGMIFLIIGIYVVLQIMTWIMSFIILFNVSSASTGYTLLQNILLLAGGASVYHYLFVKQYEY